MAHFEKTRSEITGVVAALITILGSLFAAPTANADNVDLPRYPSISPDGSRIVFSWRGDLWMVAAQGGVATRLTVHPGDDLRSAWAKDGSRVAFTSSRNGYTNIYLMNADGSDIRQVTDSDGTCALSSFGIDDEGNEVITFSSNFEGDAYRDYRPYMVSSAGGDLIRIHDAFGSYPIISPDGNRVAFSRGGYYTRGRRHYQGPEAANVWTYDRETGEFSQLTDWDGTDDRARWGGPRTLLYLSDRELNCVNLFRMSATEGQATSARVTSFGEHDVQEFDVSADGSVAVLSVWNTLYILNLDDPGAQPVPLDISAAEDEKDNYALKKIDREVTEAALSPDGKVMAMIAYGEVYVRNIEDDSPTRRVTNSHAREEGVAWSPDGLKLYYSSDDDGTESIYAATVQMTRGELKDAFVEATNPKDEVEPEDETEEAIESEVKETEEPEKPQVSLDESDNGKEDDQPAAEEEDKKEKAKKKKKKEEKELPKELQADRWHDAMTFDIEPVVQRDVNDRFPDPSPDGKMLAFRGVRGDVHIMDLESGGIRTLVESWDAGAHWRWSPDGKHIAYAKSDLNFNYDIFVVPADGSAEPVNITQHPDDDLNPRWSADGRIISFVSERVDEEFDVWRVYLDKDLEALTSLELKEYYEEATKAAKKLKPLEIEHPGDEEEEEDTDDEDDGEENDDEDGDDGGNDDEAEEEDEVNWSLEDAYLRVTRMTRLPGNEGNLEMTPAGDRLIFSAGGEESGIFSIKWDGKDKKRLTGRGSVQHVSLTGDKVTLVSSGQAATVKPSGGDMKTIAISDRIRIDLQEQSSQKFLEASRTLGEQFYHPTMHGLDWPAVTREYHTLARNARTADEFNWVGRLFVGELNASHLGIRARGERSPNSQSYGRLGTIHKRVEGGFEVLDIVPESPAAKGPMALQVGDVITAIEFKPFGPIDTVESSLKDRTGKEIAVTIKRKMEDGKPVELNVLLSPVSSYRIRSLKYKSWRRENARIVDEWSDGRLGYIHVQSMNQSSLDVFERDLFAAADGKDGLVIDVRNNGGGWTADRLLASIMVQEHAYTVPRGVDWSTTGYYPQDRLFIQRYTLPINMLCNEKSFSNAEIIAHAFKVLDRGILVGQKTYGGVISTGGFTLIDGTFVRMPFRGWFVNDKSGPGGTGTDMELNGAMPHLVVDQTPQQEVADEDAQLRAAVDNLLQRLD